VGAMGTHNCLGLAKAKGARMLVASTSEVYGTAQFVPITELHPKQPQSPYSASKIGADAIAMSYFNSHDMPIVIARPFNTYGPRQSARAVIPTIITQLANGNKKIKLGDISPTRDLNFVKDTCKGFICIAETPDIEGQVINIGSNFEVSVLEVFETIDRIMGTNAEIERDQVRVRPTNSEVYRLWCDNEKIVKLTGFKPEYTIETGLKETIEWFQIKENLSKYKSQIYNV
jgi:nucleoside-diphosphate-sugar epimerase